jgi:CMP-N,N'-diacetyllegionaminic acid synthase
MLLKKKIYALVPARGGSKGIRLKNLKRINKKNLIEIVSEFIDKCKIFDEKILSSDHKKILNLAKKLKFRIIKRSKKLSKDFITDYDVIINSLKVLKINDGYLVYLQPTSPIRKKNHLLTTLKKVIIKKYSGAWAVSKISRKFHPKKILLSKNGIMSLYDKNGKKFISRQLLNEIYIRNGVFYIFSIKKLLQSKSIYQKRIFMSETNYKISNIDNIKDLKKARKLLKVP